MVRSYSQEEKIEYVENFRMSGETIARFALENGLPETTLRDWIRDEDKIKFGEIQVEAKHPKSRANVIMFATDNIKIELKDGYDKNFLKQLMEVLINAK